MEGGKKLFWFSYFGNFLEHYLAGSNFPNISLASWFFGIWKKIGKNMKRIWIPALSTLNAWLMSLKHSNYLQYRNTMLAKQPYFRFISLAFCDPAKSKAPAKTFAYWSNLWHSGKICSTVVNLWHRSQICGTASKSFAWQPMLWPGGQICSTAAPNLWTVANYVAWRITARYETEWPNRGTVAQSVEHQLYLWRSRQICSTVDKWMHKSFPAAYIYIHGLNFYYFYEQG